MGQLSDGALLQSAFVGRLDTKTVGAPTAYPRLLRGDAFSV